MGEHDLGGESPSSRGVMLVSIHPRHAELILSGSKTVELRRTRPAVESGQPIAIYATAPTSSVIATCRVDAITSGPPDEVREMLLARAAVSPDEYNGYFHGAQVAIGIHIRDVQRLEVHIALRQLRERARFFPPQTWHFLDGSRLDHLVGGHAAHPALAAML